MPFRLRPEERPVPGRDWPRPAGARRLQTFAIYRYDPDGGGPPRIDRFPIDPSECGPMLLDVLHRIRDTVDPTLAFRRSCGEGVCGSCAMNVAGINRLACSTPIAGLPAEVKIYPLPHRPVIRDLVVELSEPLAHYRAIEPWLKGGAAPAGSERRQSPAERRALEGLWECILCFSCQSACPSVWWNGERFLGPALLLQAERWLADSRDAAGAERLAALDDDQRLYRCHSIQNCTAACPKGLQPGKAVASIKRRIATGP